MQPNQQQEVIIVGGSYAGLSAAMTLGRSMRSVLIIDNGRPANRQAVHAHNVITMDGMTPAQITARAKEQVLAYPSVRLLSGKVVSAKGADGKFEVNTETGEQFTAKKLLLATGVYDQMPDLDGFAACWGVSVLHCPYCHGYEVINQPIGLLANGELAVELVKLISHWSPKLTLLTNGPAQFTAEQRQLVERQRVTVDERPIHRLAHRDGQLEAVRFTDGSQRPLRTIFTRPTYRQHTDLAQQLGCEIGQSGIFKELIVTDPMAKTTIKGVYAAGDTSSPMRSIGLAIADGIKAGSILNRELIEERFH